jgi:hypothetical protein
MKKIKKAKIAGKLKIWEQRLASYVAIINFFMIFYLYITQAPLGLEWYYWLVIISLGCMFVLYIDIKYIFPNSQVYGFEKNPELVRLREDIQEIKTLLKKP